MQTRSTNTSTTTAAGLSASSPIITTVHNNTMNNNAEDETEQTITRREYERKRSEIEVNTANLQPHTSDVSLMAAPGKGAGTIGTTEALKKKAAFEALDEEFAPHAKKVKEDLDDTDRKTLEARKILAAAETELLHETATPLLDAIEQQGGGKASAELKPTHAAASRMQQLTNSKLSKGDIKEASRSLQNNPSETDGACAYYKFGTKMIENKRGVKVLKNQSIVASERWKILEEDGRGLPDYNAGRSHNLLTEIPKNSILLPHIFGCAEGYWLIAEEPESWSNDKSLVDLAADLFAFPDWIAMQKHIGSSDHELHGMLGKRFIGNDIVPYKTNMPAFCKKAGYIFTFPDGNDTRFDTSGQMLGLPLPAMETPSKEEFLRKHGVYVFSVEKVGDENYGIKRFRIYKDVRVEIGNRYKKKRAGSIFVKEGHMPEDVGVAKPFETTKGKFMVTRLILD